MRPILSALSAFAPCRRPAAPPPSPAARTPALDRSAVPAPLAAKGVASPEAPPSGWTDRDCTPCGRRRAVARRVQKALTPARRRRSSVLVRWPWAFVGQPFQADGSFKRRAAQPDLPFPLRRIQNQVLDVPPVVS